MNNVTTVNMQIEYAKWLRDLEQINLDKTSKEFYQEHALFFFVLFLIFTFSLGRNNGWSLDMTELIWQLVGHKFSQFKALFVHFKNKKLILIKF